MHAHNTVISSCPLAPKRTLVVGSHRINLLAHLGTPKVDAGREVLLRADQ
jgi:hypothetical protein